MTTQPFSIDLLAQAAVEPIESGMVVGLGTGRAAARGVRALAARAKAERLRVTCVCTSRATQSLAEELGLTVVDAVQVREIDYLFDGADEVAPDLSMIKGGGGAMTRERIVAHMASRRCYIADVTKRTPKLGTRFALPVEVLPLASAFVAAEIEAVAGVKGTWRAGADGLYATDNGGRVLDVAIGPRDRDWLNDLAAMLDTLPGVVDHGLFLEEADEVIIEYPAEGGRIERLEPSVEA